MANSDKNIVITPSRNLSTDPVITFTGFSNSPVTLKVPDSSVATLSFETNTNKLFKIDSNFSTGSILKIGDGLNSGSIEIPLFGSIELNRTVVIRGKGLQLPTERVNNLPNQKEGLLVYDDIDKTLRFSTSTTWFPLPKQHIWNGLVQFIDAGDPRSYPGNGNIWYDLSGNGNDLTLGPSVSFISRFGGVFRFIEDTNSFARGNGPNLSSSDNTVITFSRKTTGGNDGRVVTALNNNWLLGHHDNTFGDYYAEGWVHDIVSPTSDTTWRMYVGNGNITSDVWETYQNNRIIASNANGSQGPNGWNINQQYSQHSLSEVALVACWNRVLSASEVEQFFQMFRGRFGQNP